MKKSFSAFYNTKTDLIVGSVFNVPTALYPSCIPMILSPILHANKLAVALLYKSTLLPNSKKPLFEYVTEA